MGTRRKFASFPPIGSPKPYRDNNFSDSIREARSDIRDDTFDRIVSTELALKASRARTDDGVEIL